jgi:hypothetical protein
MTCAEARELFSALVDEALAPSERAALDAHVAGCAECRRELERFQMTVSALRIIRPIRAPVGFVDRVLQASRPTPWPRRLAARLFQPLRVKLPLEVAAMAVLGIGAVYVFQHTPELQQAARQEAPREVADERGRAAVEPRNVEAPKVERPKVEPPAAASPPAPSRPAPSPESRAEGRADQQARRKAETAVSGEVFRENRPAESKETAPAAPAVAPPPGEPLAAKKSVPAEEGRVGALRDRALEGARSRQEPAAQSRAAAPPADVAGKLVVEDPDAARLALAALIVEVGGQEVSRRAEAGVTVVDVVLSGDRYAELARGLARIGSWSVEREPAEPSGPLRLTIRMTR